MVGCLAKRSEKPGGDPPTPVPPLFFPAKLGSLGKVAAPSGSRGTG